MSRIAHIQDAIAAYEEPSLDRMKLDELKAVFCAAEREILGANISPLPC